MLCVVQRTCIQNLLMPNMDNVSMNRKEKSKVFKYTYSSVHKMIL
jgi:hypothetical protein